MRAHVHVKAANNAYIGFELHVEPETTEEIELIKAFAAASGYELTALEPLRGGEWTMSAYVTIPARK